jgi:hypothetical protein
MTVAPFRVGISRDLLDQEGRTSFDATALSILDDDASVAWEWFADSPVNINADHVAAYDAICLARSALAPRSDAPICAPVSLRASVWATTLATSTP